MPEEEPQPAVSESLHVPQEAPIESEQEQPDEIDGKPVDAMQILHRQIIEYGIQGARQMKTPPSDEDRKNASDFFRSLPY